MNTDTIQLRGLTLSLEGLCGHSLITGSTGSGKTTFLLELLTGLLGQSARNPRRKAAAVIFDVKGDLLKPVAARLRAGGRAADLVVLGPGHARAFNPLAGFTPGQITQLLIAIAGLAGQDPTQPARPDDLFWTNSREETLAALTELAVVTQQAIGQPPVNLVQLQRLSRKLQQSAKQVNDWVAEVKVFLSEAGATALEALAMLPDNTRSCVTASVSGVLGVYARSPLRELVAPVPGQPALDLADALFQQGRVIVVTAGQAEYAADLLPLMIWFKAALFHRVLSRRRRPELNQERPLWIAMDEFTRTFLPAAALGAAAEHVTLEMARASGAGFILAAQNLCGLEALGGSVVVQKLSALCRNVFFFQNTCPVSLGLAQTIFGRQTVMERHTTEVPALPPPWLTPQPEPPPPPAGNTVRVPVDKPVVPPERLARLPTGEALVKLADGTTHTLSPREVSR